jgi:hypothetical protein
VNSPSLTLQVTDTAHSAVQFGDQWKFFGLGGESRWCLTRGNVDLQRIVEFLRNNRSEITLPAELRNVPGLDERRTVYGP